MGEERKDLEDLDKEMEGFRRCVVDGECTNGLHCRPSSDVQHATALVRREGLTICSTRRACGASTVPTQ